MNRSLVPRQSSLLLLTLSALVVILQGVRPGLPAVPGGLSVRSPALVTRLTLSFDAVAADFYWIRCLQYYGRMRLSGDSDKRYDELYPLLDITTSLDPHFRIAYRFGAILLSEHAPGGPSRPDLAITLLTKAMAAEPNRWEYPYDVGFVHYREGEYRKAAEWFERAAAIPGSANWLTPLAAATLAAGGDLGSSRALWQRVAESREPWLVRTAEHRLRQLETIDSIHAVQPAVAEFRRRYGTSPASWDALIDAGLLRGVPVDAAGIPLELRSEESVIDVRRESPMWPLPTAVAGR